MSPPSEPPRSSYPPRRPLIVVADGDRAAREHLATVLRASAFEVEAVADGLEAVERVARGGVDVVTLDVVMPRQGGFEACRVLKANPEPFLPVLFVTSRIDAPSRLEGFKLGADDYLGKPFDDAELVARVQVALRTKRLYDAFTDARVRLERFTVIDELTGLYNYRHALARLGEEFKRAERSHEPLACAVLDIDRLRTWNERGGRPFGDSLIRGVAELVRRSVREADIVARYGGDEFLILLPSTHFAGSVSVAERIWRDLGSRSWGQPVAGKERVTLSMGIAAYPSRDVRTKEGLVRAAEAALNRAKRDGMDRLCVYQQESLVFSPTLDAGAAGAAQAQPRRSRPDGER